jgi:hypothetical protein
MAEAHSRSDGSPTDPSVVASGTYESTSPKIPKDSVQTSTSEPLGSGPVNTGSTASPLDLTDPEIWEMANRHHRPDEAWTVGGNFIGLFCEKCGQTYPCATRQALRATPFTPTTPTAWTARGS